MNLQVLHDTAQLLRQGDALSCLQHAPSRRFCYQPCAQGATEPAPAQGMNTSSAEHGSYLPVYMLEYAVSAVSVLVKQPALHLIRVCHSKHVACRALDDRKGMPTQGSR